MISKELLSLVLDETINSYEIEDSHCRNSRELYIKAKGEECGYGETEYSFQINLDTLGRLCKEWIYKNGSNYSIRKDDSAVSVHVYWQMQGSVEFVAYTELEAIIKATEYVYSLSKDRVSLDSKEN